MRQILSYLLVFTTMVLGGLGLSKYSSLNNQQANAINSVVTTKPTPTPTSKPTPTQDVGIGTTSTKVTPNTESIPTPQLTKTQIKSIVDSSLDSYIKSGKLKGPKGDKGDTGEAGKPGTNGSSGITTSYTTPSGLSIPAQNLTVSYTPPGAGNPGSVGSITYFSSKELTTNKLTANGETTLSSLLVSGNTTLSNLTAGIINSRGGDNTLGAEQILYGDFSKIVGDELVIDTSTLGDEKVTNGSFTDNANSWTLGSGWSYSSNAVTNNGTSIYSDILSQPVTFQSGYTYRISLDIGGSTGLVQICFDISLNCSVYEQYSAGVGHVEFDITAEYDSTQIAVLPYAFFNGSIDNVSIKRLTFNSGNNWTNIGTGWTDNGGGSFTHMPGESALLENDLEFTVDKAYRVAFSISESTTDGIQVDFTDTGGDTFTGNGEHELIQLASDNPDPLHFSPDGVNFDGIISNISVKESYWQTDDSGWTFSGNKASHTPSQGIILDSDGLYEDGADYQVNDVLTIDAGNHDATITVTAVDGSGSITDWTLTTPGTGYVEDECEGYDLTGGSGTGATINCIIRDNTGWFWQDGILTDGATYQVSLVVGGNQGTVTVYLGTDNTYHTYNAGSGAVSFNGTYSDVWNSKILFEPSPDFNGSIENVSVKSVTYSSVQSWSNNNGSEVLKIDNDGNLVVDGKIGINTTNDLNDLFTIENGGILINSTTLNSPAHLDIIQNDPVDELGFGIYVGPGDSPGVGYVRPSISLDTNHVGCDVCSSINFQELGEGKATISYDTAYDRLAFWGQYDYPNVVFKDSGNVGIGTVSPQRILDISGVERITSTTTTSSFAENFVIRKDVAQAVGSYTEIADFTTENGAFNIEVEVIDGQSGGSSAKKFVINGNYDDYVTAGWMEVLPLYSTGERGGDYTVDVAGSSVTGTGNVRLRLRTTKTTFIPGGVNVTLHIKTVNTSLVNTLNNTGVGATVSGIFRNSALTQNTGLVGIATSSPWRTLSLTGTLALDGLSTGPGAGTLCLGASKEVLYSAGATCTVSSAKFKHDIATSTAGLDLINKLRPVTFFYNDDIGVPGEQYGFIAEEVEQLDPKLVVHDKDNKPFSVKYENMTAILAKAIQEQQTEINQIKASTTGPIIHDSSSLLSDLEYYAGQILTGIWHFVEIVTDKITATLGVFKRVETENIDTQEICLTNSNGKTCVTRNELEALLHAANISGVTHVDNDSQDQNSNPTPSPTPAIEQATTTDSVTPQQNLDNSTNSPPESDSGSVSQDSALTN